MGKTPEFDLAASPGHLLHRAQQFAAEHFAKAMPDDMKLTQRQFAVLAATAGQEGLTQTDLVRATGIDRSTLAELVSRMVTRKLLRRERVPGDARANAIHLTDEGRTVYDAALASAMAADASIMESLPKNKRSSFLETLRRISMSIEEAEAKIKADALKEKEALKKEAKKAAKKAKKKEKKKKKK